MGTHNLGKAVAMDLASPGKAVAGDMARTMVRMAETTVISLPRDVEGFFKQSNRRIDLCPDYQLGRCLNPCPKDLDHYCKRRLGTNPFT